MHATSASVYHHVAIVVITVIVATLGCLPVNSFLGETVTPSVILSAPLPSLDHLRVLCQAPVRSLSICKSVPCDALTGQIHVWCISVSPLLNPARLFSSCSQGIDLYSPPRCSLCCELTFRQKHRGGFWSAWP